MRVGIHYHVPGYRGAGGQFYIPGYLGRFIESLADACGEVVFFCHSPGEVDSNAKSVLPTEKIRIVDLGPHTPVPSRLMASSRIRRMVRAHSDAFDVMLIRAPTPLIGAVASGARPKPTALLLVGDYLAGVSALPQPWWRRELIRAWILANKHVQDRVAKRSLVLVNSRPLFREYQSKARKVLETRTTTLSEGDFDNRISACSSRPIRVLHSGRLTHEKGLFDVLAALEIVKGRGIEVCYDLVGWGDKGRNIEDQLMVKGNQVGIPVQCHGFRSVGPDLFRFYSEADVFVLGSRSSFEGFPRTIWEAMAHSLPVVATRVGSIPDFLRDGQDAVLANPKCPESLATGIERVVLDGELRKRLIENGIALARSNTLERRAQEIATALHRWIVMAESGNGLDGSSGAK